MKTVFKVAIVVLLVLFIILSFTVFDFKPAGFVLIGFGALLLAAEVYYGETVKQYVKKTFFNMFDMLKKYRVKNGGFNQEKIDSILSINPSEKRKILQTEYAMMDAIDNDESLSFDDKGLMKNLVLIEKYPFDWENCRKELKSGDKQELDKVLENVKITILDTIRKVKRVGYQHRDGLSNAEANEKAIESMYGDNQEHENITLDMIAFLQANHLSGYNSDEKKMITTMLIMDDKNITYDVFSCDKNIISNIINDSTHRKYMYMFYGQKDLVYLRNLYLLINDLESHTSLHNQVHYLNEADHSLITQLKQRCTNKNYQINFDKLGELSGITKLKLKKADVAIHDLYKYEGERIYNDLLNTGEVFVALLKKLRSSIPDIYEEPTSSNYFDKKTEVLIDGADEANTLVEMAITNKRCPSQNVVVDHNLNLNQWCKDGKLIPKKALILHPDRNFDCQESANKKMQDIGIMCTRRKGGTGMELATVETSENVNVKKINDAIYFGKAIDIDDSFRSYLSAVNLHGKRTIQLIEFSLYNDTPSEYELDLYDNGFIEPQIQEILKCIKHEGTLIHINKSSSPFTTSYFNDINLPTINKRPAKAIYGFDINGMRLD